MQIIILILVSVCSVWLVLVSVYIGFSLIRIAEKLEVELPLIGDRKKKLEEAKEEEIRNAQYDQMLAEISAEKEEKAKVKAAAEAGYDYNELDQIEEIYRSESDPDALMELLEFGLPDEELDQILNSLEAPSESAVS